MPITNYNMINITRITYKYYGNNRGGSNSLPGTGFPREDCVLALVWEGIHR
jgi:hypothetical protein